MELEVGMYARTKHKGIIKIDKVIDNGVITYEDDLGREWEEETGRKVIRYIGKDGWNCGLDEKDILKASHNIIDLIQGNDFVNGHRVISVDRESLELDIETFMYHCGYETINGNTDIKSIVTKEQFESMSYKVGD